MSTASLQIEEFRRLRSHVKGAELPEGNDGILGDNFRPTQPLSDRTVRAAFQWLSLSTANVEEVRDPHIQVQQVTVLHVLTQVVSKKPQYIQTAMFQGS